MTSPSSSSVPCLSPPSLLPSSSSASPNNKATDAQMEIETNPIKMPEIMTSDNITGEGKRKRNKLSTIPREKGVAADVNNGDWLSSGNYITDTSLEEIEGMIVQFFSSKEGFLDIYKKETALDLLRRLSLEIVRISAIGIDNLEKNNIHLERISFLEEKVSALTAQTFSIQSNSENVHAPGTSSSSSYLDAARKGVTAVTQGWVVPPPSIPSELKHSPAERVLLVKAEEKGTTNTKEKQERFRNLVKETIGKHNEVEVTAIRPTKHGGYLIITRSEQARDNIHTKLKNSGYVHESRIIAPTKKYAKMICRDTPHEGKKNEILNDLYGKHNPQLAAIPNFSRKANIYVTKLGWIFELSSAEAAAIDAQGGKIRHGFGCELRLEEHIPLQQCYRCCKYGHNASDCTGKEDICRLCATRGHCGRECPVKNERKRWKCHNCNEANQTMGLNLNTNHAAAQMHKCAIAEHEKDVRRSQLAAAGVYTTKKSTRNATVNANKEHKDVNTLRGRRFSARNDMIQKNKSNNIQAHSGEHTYGKNGNNTLFTSFTPSSSSVTISSSSFQYQRPTSSSATNLMTASTKNNKQTPIIPSSSSSSKIPPTSSSSSHNLFSIPTTNAGGRARRAAAVANVHLSLPETRNSSTMEQLTTKYKDVRAENIIGRKNEKGKEENEIDIRRGKPVPENRENLILNINKKSGNNQIENEGKKKEGKIADENGNEKQINGNGKKITEIENENNSQVQITTQRRGRGRGRGKGTGDSSTLSSASGNSSLPHVDEGCPNSNSTDSASQGDYRSQMGDSEAEMMTDK